MYFCRTKWGLERFVPASILSSTKRKALQKQLVQHLALDLELLMRNQTTVGQSRGAVSSAVKLRYVNRLMKLQDFGGRYFDAALAVSRNFATVQRIFASLECR
jgi:hypothetical protein